MAKNLGGRFVSSAPCVLLSTPRISDRVKDYCFYIMANRSKTLYCGFTSNLPKHVYEHKHMLVDGFTRRYLKDRLVYYEVTNDVNAGIRREKQVKGWLRRRKVALIESVNPTWRDLSDDF